MIVVFEIGGLAVLLVVVWVLFRAARARPADSGLKITAWLGIAVWLAFSALLLGDDLANSDIWALARNALIVTVILGAVLGYRHVIGILRDRAGRK